MTTALALPTQTPGELLRRYPVIEIAKAFREGTETIGRLMRQIDEQSKAMRAAFRAEEEKSDSLYDSTFSIDFSYHSERRFRRDTEHDCPFYDAMKREAWRTLVNRIGLRNIMSVKKRKEFDEQLQSGELPDITEDSILSVLMGLCEQAKDFAKEASLEVFALLRPGPSWGTRYKTNDTFRVGRRVILSGYVDQGFGAGRFRPSHYHEQELIAIDGVFHLLDGKGVMRENRGPLVNAINECVGGRGSTEYFRFKCFMNRNLHLEFKRLDLVQELNMQAVGERVLGDDVA